MGRTGAGSWPFKREGEDPEVDGRGEGPCYIRGPSGAGSPICHFLSTNKSLAFEILSCFSHRHYPVRWSTTSGERWPQSPQPLPPSPRSWFPPTSKLDRGELEALASPQGGGGGRRLPGRDRPEGGRTFLLVNNRRCSGRAGHWRSPLLAESLAHWQ